MKQPARDQYIKFITHFVKKEKQESMAGLLQCLEARQLRFVHNGYVKKLQTDINRMRINDPQRADQYEKQLNTHLLLVSFLEKD